VNASTERKLICKDEVQEWNGLAALWAAGHGGLMDRRATGGSNAGRKEEGAVAW
jgi:hypothetical protein